MALGSGCACTMTIDSAPVAIRTSTVSRRMGCSPFRLLGNEVSTELCGDYNSRNKGAEMTRIVLSAARIFLLSLMIAWVGPTTTFAQWEPFAWKNVPRTPDGKVDLNAPPRRAVDGKPDLSGFWMPTDNVKYLLNLAADLKPEDIPFQPWAAGVYKERIETNGKDHPGVRCLPSGIP